MSSSLAVIFDLLLKNRGLLTEADRHEFLNPSHPSAILPPFDTNPAVELVSRHILEKNKIAVYGDYDVDGICSVAILWETISRAGGDAFPYIPLRAEGYGLTTTGIDKCVQQGAKLLVVADSGISAKSQIDYCHSLGCETLVIDHHEPPGELPSPTCLLFSKDSCAAGLSWFFAKSLGQIFQIDVSISEEHLSLVSLAVICDLVPLKGINRSFAKHGLKILGQTRRPGLIELFSIAKVEPANITPYEVGFMIGPRLNASGRLKDALDSLRLLCTKNSTRALELAKLLDDTNRMRQEITTTSVDLAISQLPTTGLPDFIMVADRSFDPGVIGLISGKLTEKYHRPSVAISVGDKESKGSGRSISDFDITAYLRTRPDLFTSLGGHPMATGFSLPSSKLEHLKEFVSEVKLDASQLVKKTFVDATISLADVGESLLQKISQLEPFGLGNPQPVFLAQGVQASGVTYMGTSSKHLRFMVSDSSGGRSLPVVYFNFTDQAPDILKSNIDLFFSLKYNYWQNRRELQILTRGIKSSDEPVSR